LSKNSSSILVFGWAVVVAAIFGLILSVFLNSKSPEMYANYLSGQCAVGNSFYQINDLKNEEKAQYSKNAISIAGIGVSKEKYRILVDYNYYSDVRNKLSVKYIVLSDTQKVENISASILVNAVEKELSFNNNSPKENNLNFISGSDTIDIAGEHDVIGFLLKKDNQCEIKINNLIELKPEFKNEIQGYTETIGVPSNNEFELKPGINYYGSLDWLDFNPLQRKGFKILFYDGSKKKWVKENSYAEPGRAYVIFNPTKSIIKLEKLREYRVPDDINTYRINKGWNLIYIGNGENISKIKFTSNNNSEEFVTNEKFLISDLIAKKLVSQKIYVLKDGKPQNVDLKDTNGYKGPVWVYLFDDPAVSLRQINLSIPIKGGGDSYKAGNQVSFKVSVLNNDVANHYLANQSSSDSCQLRLEVLNQKDNLVYDSSGGRNCAIWPKLDELPPGQKKEYNYSWVIPKDISGKLKVRAIFDYSRLGGEIINETEIDVK
jgi:hypothetical protein